MVAGGVAGAAFLVSIAAIWGVEGTTIAVAAPSGGAPPPPAFTTALREMWG